MTVRCVIVDIDGILADAGHRLHHVTGKDWPAFFAAMADDPVVEPIRLLLEIIVNSSLDAPDTWLDNKIVMCSGRPDDYRGITENWLERHDVPYDALYMRPAGDRRSDVVVKREMLTALRAEGYEPWLAIDDRPSIVAMWREEGITCLQCRDNDDSQPQGRLTLMVGPSGAGKTSWLRGEGGVHPWHVISADQVRQDLCGDFRDQSRNEEVFAAVHAVARARLQRGLPTVIDATHLRRKDRLAAALLTRGPVRYVVVDRPLADKLVTADWRPIELIVKHDQAFRSNLKDILAGDGLPNVTVVDLR